MEDQGRCVSCGYLCKQSQSLPARFYEASWSERERGDLISQRRTLWSDAMRQSMPMDERTHIRCFVRAANLLQEVPAPESVGSMEATLEVIRQDRKCPEWVPWQEGYSPKEHLEDYKMQRLENERREFELKMEARAQEAQNRNRRIDLALAAAGILLAAAQILTASPDALIVTWFTGRASQDTQQERSTPVAMATPPVPSQSQG